MVHLPGSLCQDPAGNQNQIQCTGRYIYRNAHMETKGAWTPLKYSVHVSQQRTAKAKGVCLKKGSLFTVLNNANQ